MKLDTNMIRAISATTAIEADATQAIQRKLADMQDVSGYAYQQHAGYPGAGEGGSHEVMRSYSIAALVVSGLISWSGKTGLVYGRKIDSAATSVFYAITRGNARPFNPLIRKGDIEGLVKKCSGATKQQAVGRYNALVAAVDTFIGLIQNGGAADIFDTKGNKVHVRMSAEPWTVKVDGKYQPYVGSGIE